MYNMMGNAPRPSLRIMIDIDYERYGHAIISKGCLMGQSLDSIFYCDTWLGEG